VGLAINTQRKRALRVQTLHLVWDRMKNEKHFTQLDSRDLAVAYCLLIGSPNSRAQILKEVPCCFILNEFKFASQRFVSLSIPWTRNQQEAYSLFKNTEKTSFCFKDNKKRHHCQDQPINAV
jgi:hypothetical protein